jgi:hypothetical protein
MQLKVEIRVREITIEFVGKGHVILGKAILLDRAIAQTVRAEKKKMKVTHRR